MIRATNRRDRTFCVARVLRGETSARGRTAHRCRAGTAVGVVKDLGATLGETGIIRFIARIREKVDEGLALQ